MFEKCIIYIKSLKEIHSKNLDPTKQNAPNKLQLYVQLAFEYGKLLY